MKGFIASDKTPGRTAFLRFLFQLETNLHNESKLQPLARTYTIQLQF